MSIKSSTKTNKWLINLIETLDEDCLSNLIFDIKKILNKGKVDRTGHGRKGPCITSVNCHIVRNAIYHMTAEQQQEIKKDIYKAHEQSKS